MASVVVASAEKEMEVEVKEHKRPTWLARQAVPQLASRVPSRQHRAYSLARTHSGYRERNESRIARKLLHRKDVPNVPVVILKATYALYSRRHVKIMLSKLRYFVFSSGYWVGS